MKCPYCGNTLKRKDDQWYCQHCDSYFSDDEVDDEDDITLEDETEETEYGENPSWKDY